MWAPSKGTPHFFNMLLKLPTPVCVCYYLHLFKNSIISFHTFSVEEMLSLSLGVWISKLSGPNETQSRLSIFPEMIPHSSPAWIDRKSVV